MPSGDTLEPDVSFISTRRRAAGPAPEFDKFLRLTPDLVIEVISPRGSRRDNVAKKAIYARNGVDEYWLVDPRKREVTVLLRSGSAFGEPAVFRKGPVMSAILPGLVLTIEKLFDDL